MRTDRLRKTADFDRAFKEGKSAAGNLLVVHAVPNGLPVVRAGFPVSKRLGGACKRNRIRRLLRESVRLSGAVPRSGWDLVIIPRRRIAGPDIRRQQVMADLDRVLARLGIDQTDGSSQ